MKSRVCDSSDLSAFKFKRLQWPSCKSDLCTYRGTSSNRNLTQIRLDTCRRFFLRRECTSRCIPRLRDRIRPDIHRYVCRMRVWYLAILRNCSCSYPPVNSFVLKTLKMSTTLTEWTVLTVLMHLFWHGPWPFLRRHSLTSTQVPSTSRNPGPQMHFLEPMVLTHFPLQPPLFTSHSFTSVRSKWGRSKLPDREP